MYYIYHIIYHITYTYIICYMFYQELISAKSYFSTAETTFKEQYTNRCKDTKHQKYQNSTDLVKHIWQLKKVNINWTKKTRKH